ncbi:hypothetical protein E2320_019022, partial [Naja naja]
HATYNDSFHHHPFIKKQLVSCFFLEGCWPECLPSITEEREEQSIEENNPLSGLGTNVKTQIINQTWSWKKTEKHGKSFEDLKIDTSRIDMQYQDSNEAEIRIQTHFWNIQKTLSPIKLLGRVSFDQHNLSSPDQWKIGKQLGKCLQLERKVVFPDDKSTNCFISSGVVKCQHNKDESWSESRKESNSDCDDEEMQWHEQLSDVKTQVDGKMTLLLLVPKNILIPIWFMEGLGDDVSQATGKSSLDVSDFQNIEWEQPNPEDHSSKFQINQGTQRIGQCKINVMLKQMNVQIPN